MRWADFTKAFSIYPETNERVRSAIDAFFDALRDALDASEGETEPQMEILFFDDGMLIGEWESDLKTGTNLRWLHDRIHKSTLAGVAFSKDATEEALLAFTRRLLKHYVRDILDSTLEDLWPEPYEGMQLIERRFDGDFREGGVVGGARIRGRGRSDGVRLDPTDNQELVALLACDDRIAGTLERIRERLENTTESGAPVHYEDILDRIVQLLPQDIADNYETIAEATSRVLELLEERIRDSDPRGGPPPASETTTLNRLLFVASRGLLAHRGPAAGNTATGRIPIELEQAPTVDAWNAKEVTGSGHAGDKVIEDDEEAFLAEFEGLPPPWREEITTENAESAAEEIGAYLNHLTHIDSPEDARRLHPMLARLLSSAGPEGLSVLRRYLETPRGPADGERTDSGGARIMNFLLEARLAHLLRTCGFLSSETVRQHFPRGFGLYLDTIAVDNPRDVQDLNQICARLAPETVQAEREHLLRAERLLENDRVTRLLAVASDAALPLARLVLEDGDQTQRRAAAFYLRRIHLRAEETCLLHIYDDLDALPVSYLVAIASPHATGTYPMELGIEVASLICRYLHTMKGRPENAARRAYAIRHLASFPTRAAKEMLEEILGARRLLILPAEPHEIREAARQALKLHGRK